MPEHWPGAAALIVASVCGVLNLWQQLQNRVMRGRLDVLEREHAACREMLGTKWPSDLAFVEKVKQLKEAMRHQGKECSMEHAAMIARRHFR